MIGMPKVAVPPSPVLERRALKDKQGNIFKNMIKLGAPGIALELSNESDLEIPPTGTVVTAEAYLQQGYQGRLELVLTKITAVK